MRSLLLLEAPYLRVQRRMRYLLTKADMMGNEGGSNPSGGEGRGAATRPFAPGAKKPRSATDCK